MRFNLSSVCRKLLCLVPCMHTTKVVYFDKQICFIRRTNGEVGRNVYTKFGENRTNNTNVFETTHHLLEGIS